MTRLEKVLKEQGIEDNEMNRGHLICFKCPHNYPCIDYFTCDGSGLREEYGEYDKCRECWGEDA